MTRKKQITRKSPSPFALSSRYGWFTPELGEGSKGQRAGHQVNKASSIAARCSDGSTSSPRTELSSPRTELSSPRTVIKFIVILSVLIATIFAPAPAESFGPKTQFRFVVLDLGGGESERTAALQRLAYEVRKRTSIEVATEVLSVPLEAAQIFNYPFLILPVCRGLPELTPAQLLLLRRYLDVGGFLFVDNCQGRPGGAADEWIHKQLGRVYPERAFKPVPQDHSVTRSFYLIDRAYGRSSDKSDFESIDDGDRTIILVNPNDMLGALMRDPFGNPIYEMPERQREMAHRQGVNIALYALTLNYKKDQIHIPFILKRRQR